MLEEPPRMPNFQPRPWQQKVIDILSAEPNDRTIYWVRDSEGGRGKTQLAKYLLCEKEACLLGGRIADMAYMWNRDRKYKIGIFDLTRTQAETTDHLYTFAEQLKNGFFTSTKYISKLKMFAVPHVIFFSNSMPKEDKWSADRLHLIDLDADNEENHLGFA